MPGPDCGSVDRLVAADHRADTALEGWTVVDTEARQCQGAQKTWAWLEAIAGQPDRWLHCLGPGQLAVLLVGVPEQGDGAEDADRHWAAGGVAPRDRCTGWAQQIVGLAAFRATSRPSRTSSALAYASQ